MATGGASRCRHGLASDRREQPAREKVVDPRTCAPLEGGMVAAGVPYALACVIGSYTEEGEALAPLAAAAAAGLPAAAPDFLTLAAPATLAGLAFPAGYPVMVGWDNDSLTLFYDSVSAALGAPLAPGAYPLAFATVGGAVCNGLAGRARARPGAPSFAPRRRAPPGSFSWANAPRWACMTAPRGRSRAMACWTRRGWRR